MTERNPESPKSTIAAEHAESTDQRSKLFNNLFREHNRSLMRFLVTRLRSVQEARDVAQEAYVRLLQLHEPGAVSLLRSYLFRTAANLAVDRLRRRAVRERASVELFDELSEQGMPERAAMARQEYDLVRAAIASLPAKTREAFVLRIIDGVPALEVARRMGLKERMVREHVARALAECKRALQGGTP
jgi:RNA polymerase sigma-70 factor (ECF subfamily)